MSPRARVIASLLALLLTACAVGPSPSVHPAPPPAPRTTGAPAAESAFLDSLVTGPVLALRNAKTKHAGRRLSPELKPLVPNAFPLRKMR